MMHETHTFSDHGVTYGLHVTRPQQNGCLPAVLVFHTWHGQGDLERNKAAQLTQELGVVGVACDLFGHGVYAEDAIACGRLMTPLMRDRNRLRQLLTRTVEEVRALSGVDSARRAAIGYCFGGLCVLELARGAAPLQSVVSFHGLFKVEEALRAQPATHKVSVLAFHGFDDPMVAPEETLDLQRELSAAAIPFQLHTFGQTKHGFTNPAATDPTRGVFYNADADRQSWQTTLAFLRDTLSLA